MRKATVYRWTVMSLFLSCLALRVQAAALPDFTGLVKQASPAIVNISSQQNGDSSEKTPYGHGQPEDIPDIFKHFFGERGFNDPRRRHGKSLGSGFIISSDGYLLTNHHVVKDADEIIVRLSDRRELEARLVGADARSDLALLKIEGEGFPTVKLGDSDLLEAGEWVLAIGSPFGFDHTVTAGIVSATGRSLANENYVPFIQTDVAINPGNSGGPLFNLKGEVVGINSQIYTRSGGFMGLSFAIPITMAMDVVGQLRERGHVARGWLGVIIQEVNKDLAESFGLDKPRGALIAKVLPDSPSADSGLQEGDIIVTFNGEQVERSAELPQMVGLVRPGKTVNLGVIRNGKAKDIRLKVGDLPGDGELQRAAGSALPEKNRLAISVAALESERKAKWNITGGVVVRSIEAGPGADAGLVVGDVITMLNGKAIDSIERFHSLVSELPKGRAVPMRIVRRGSPLFLPIKVQ